MFSRTQYTVILTLAYMMGIIAFFKNYVIFFSILLGIVTISLLLKKKISNLFAVFLTGIFIFGITYTNHKMQTNDLLKSLAPTDATITGQIITIPSTTQQNKTKFFVNVSKIETKTANYKTKSNILFGIIVKKLQLYIEITKKW